MERSPTILFVPACGPQVGGGHVMRLGAFAAALRARGAGCVFAVAAEGAAILDRFYPAAFAVCDVARADIAALAALAERPSPDAVVFDDYRLERAAEQRMAAPGRVLMAVDDLADRPHVVDILLDPGLRDGPDPYADLAPRALRLLGPAYALLRPGFAAARARRSTATLQRLFVSFGLSDVDGVAARAVGLIRRSAPDVALDVVIASSAASRSELEARAATDPALALHLDAPDVAALMAGADAAVGAGGSGVWERCASGLASLAVVVADNQRVLVRTLAARGATLACDLADPDFDAAFTSAFKSLLDRARRAALGSAGQALCDGRGAERAADALLAAIKDRSAGRPGPIPSR